MQYYYREDIKVFFSIENLENIQNLFKNVKRIKGNFHKFLIYNDSNEFYFNSNDYILNNQNSENDMLQKNAQEKKSINEGNVSTIINCTKSNNGDDNSNKNKKKKDRHELICADKYINDEYEFISEEIFKYLYKNDKNIVYTNKYKILMNIIMQAIIYSNKIKMNIYKMNLFISIIIMTLYKLIELLKEKNKTKKTKTKTINYFINLLENNTQYILPEERVIRNASSLNENLKVLGKEKKNIEEGEQTKNYKELNKKMNKDDLRSQNMIDNNKLQNEILHVDKLKNGSTNKDKDNRNSKDVGNKGTLILDASALNENTEMYIDKDIVLFQHRESKYIIKYMFESIFSIYHILEYIFLFSSFNFDTSFTNHCSFISPTETVSTNDQMQHNGGELDNKFITNFYIKEALNIPFYVLDKFHSNVHELKEKVNSIIK